MKLRYCAFASVFAALTFLATTFLQIPIVGGAGYVHLGDVFVLLAAMMLPLPYALVASAFGAALADIASGFVLYAPATAVVKALMVLVAWAVCRKSHSWWVVVLSFVAATIVLAAGYFVYEIFLYGISVALVDILSNLLQGAVCSVVAFVVFKLVQNRLVI